MRRAWHIGCAAPAKASSMKPSMTGELAHNGESVQGEALVTSAAPPAQAGPAMLSVVVPTYNECENVSELVRRLAHQLVDVAWEVIFVDDDSPDGTADVVRAIARRDPRVRCIQRVGRRGLSSACIEGVMASSAPFVAVMDADLQHDEAILPLMLSTVQTSGIDVAVGSRYVAGGSMGDWDRRRAMVSRLATRLSHLVVPADLRDGRNSRNRTSGARLRCATGAGSHAATPDRQGQD